LYLGWMEWWFKCEKYPVNAGNSSILQDSLKDTLKQANNLAVVNLYNDQEFYYIKTNNKMSVNHYLSQNKFVELDEEKSAGDLRLLYGLS
jgi:hypothetical protein